MTTAKSAYATLTELAHGILLDSEQQAQQFINLVASENHQTMQSRLPFLLDGYNRYFFREVGSNNDYGFRGAQALGDLEQRVAIPVLQQLLNSEYVSVRPLSGLNAMASVFAAFGGPVGSRCVTLHPAQGGHSATRPLAERLGLLVSYLPGDGPHSIDIDAFSKQCEVDRPGLIYLDQSNALFPYLDLQLVRAAAAAARPDAVIHVDCSHWLGLILGGQLPNPLDYGADTISGSTHKTLAGPQKGFVATRSAGHWQRFRATQGTIISSHHVGAAASLALALLEYVDGGPGSDYAKRVTAHAQMLGRELARRGLDVFAADRGFTGSHQLWLDTARRGIEPSAFADRLCAAGIRVTDLPYLPGIEGPAIRLGTQEATHLGMRSDQIPILAELISDAADRRSPPATLKERTTALRATWQGQQSVALPISQILEAYLD